MRRLPMPSRLIALTTVLLVAACGGDNEFATSDSQKDDNRTAEEIRGQANTDETVHQYQCFRSNHFDPSTIEQPIVTPDVLGAPGQAREEG